MAANAIVFGALLTVLGGVLFALATNKSPTALIPSGLGLLLVILGLAARSEKARMHAMHGAALVGLVGLIGGAVVGFVQWSGEKSATAWGGSFSMAALSGVFLVLCIKSFIDARRRRKQNG